MQILFLAARFPYPPLRGDQVRAYHQLRLLGTNHDITLLALTDRQLPAAAYQMVKPYCQQIITVPLRRMRSMANLLMGVGSKYPFQTLLYQTATMKAAVQNALDSQKFDVAHIQLARMAPYFENITAIPRVIDLIDALSLNMKRRYQRDTSPLKWAAYLEWKRLSRYERLICQTFERATVVSDVDRQVIGAYPNLMINPNGVDLAHFKANDTPREAASLIFSGNMGYFPNVNAVLWFVRQVLPRLKRAVPDVKLYVVGARPAPEIQQLARQDPAIVVTGFVDDISSYLAQAAVAVAPMQAGSGSQFKVIEAMASGTPVVATAHVLGGIAGLDGEHLLIANDAPAFAAQIIRLLQDDSLARRLAQNGRRLVEENYSWENSVAALESIYDAVAA